MQTNQATQAADSHANEGSFDPIESAFEGIESESTETVESNDSNESEEVEEVATSNDADDESEESNDSQDDESQSKNESEDIWPKKAQNALARSKAEKRKLIAEVHQLREALTRNNQLNQQKQKEQVGNEGADKAPPREDDFETYADYLEARVEYSAEKRFNERMKAQNEQAQKNLQQQQYEAARNARLEQVNMSAKDLAQKIPDLAEVIQGSSIDTLPKGIQNLILSARNPSLAAYNLAKEGILDQLAYMPEHMIAAEIVRAQGIMPRTQVQAQEQGTEQTSTSKTFKPISTPRGAGGGSSSVSPSDSWEKLSKFLES